MSSVDIQGRYFGQRKPLFLLYLRTAFLTLITLGIYRFWAKTRIRKYIWSATSGDGDGFEYTGTGLEKFLGFLVAVVILAIYLGVIQMALFFFGLNLFTEPTSQAQAIAQILSIYITLLAVLPLIFFAQYRARRYRMARTRWRGIRFGMENAAWGYALRAMGYYFVTLITGGLLAPLSTFRLEEYMANRTWYGDARFDQKGRWQDLYRGMKHVFIGLAIMIGVSVLAGLSGSVVFVFLGLAVGYIWFMIGLVAYRVYALNYLTRHKLLDGVVAFDISVDTRQVIGIVVVGTLVVALVGGLTLGMIGGIVAMSTEALMTGAGLGAVVASLFMYVMALLIIGGLNLVMITQPIIEHAVNSVVVRDSHHLDRIRQRAADLGADAEGFADALDVGGAI